MKRMAPSPSSSDSLGGGVGAVSDWSVNDAGPTDCSRPCLVPSPRASDEYQSPSAKIRIDPPGPDDSHSVAAAVDHGGSGSASSMSVARSLVVRVPRDLQLLLAQSLTPNEVVRLARTCRALRRLSDEEVVWRAFCQRGEDGTRPDASLAQIGGDSEGAEHDSFQWTADVAAESSTALPASITRSSVPLSHEYHYLLPSLTGVDASRARARPALSSSLVGLPPTEPACSWKHVFRSLRAFSRRPRLPITSLLLPGTGNLTSSAVRASSRDDENQDVGATLKLSARSGGSGVAFFSSAGCETRRRPIQTMPDGSQVAADDAVDEWLLYRSYAHPLSFLTRLRVQFYQCHYQRDEPIYTPSFLRVRVGYEEGRYHYTSPWYPVLDHAEFQDFFFHDPAQWRDAQRPGPVMLVAGTTVLVEMREYNAVQPAPGDSLYYLVVAAVELEGVPIERLHEEDTLAAAAESSVVDDSQPTFDPPLLPAIMLAERHALLGGAAAETLDLATSTSSCVAAPRDVDCAPGPLTHAALSHQYASALASPLARQSVADYRVNRALCDQFALHLSTASWKRLGQLLADACEATSKVTGEQLGFGQQPEEEEEEEEDGQAAPAPAQDAPMPGPSPAVSSSNATDAVTTSSPTAASASPIVGRTRMYRRFRDLVLDAVLARSRRIAIDAMSVAAASPAAAASSNKVAHASRSHALAIATYLVQLLFRFVALTEFESYVLACVDGTVKGLLSPALQQQALTFSMRLGHVFMARQQHTAAAQLYSMARADGRTADALCYTSRLFPQLMQVMEHVTHSHGLTHEDMLKRIATIHSKASPGDLLEPPALNRTHKAVVEFALLCMRAGRTHFGAPDHLLSTSAAFRIIGLPYNENVSSEPIALLDGYLQRILDDESAAAALAVDDQDEPDDGEDAYADDEQEDEEVDISFGDSEPDDEEDQEEPAPDEEANGASAEADEAS